MRIAIYTIALNEEQFVKRWYDAAKDADVLLITDTGSTDNTVELARSLGIDVHVIKVDPWRFDVARNMSVDLLPDDIDVMIQIDMDEVISPGWRSEIERAFERGERPMPLYTWNHNNDGSPAIQFFYNKVTPRHGYRWHNRAHECILPEPGIIDNSVHYPSIEVHHWPDRRKSRSQYLGLLKQDAEEMPENPRAQYYYGRELFFYKKLALSIRVFKHYLELPGATWGPERSKASSYIAEAYESNKPDSKNAEFWYLRAVAEAPEAKEAYYGLIRFYMRNKNWAECAKFGTIAQQIKAPNITFLSQPECWNGLMDKWIDHSRNML